MKADPQFAETAIVVCTGYLDDDDERLACEAGADGYIELPSSIEQHVRMMTDLLAFVAPIVTAAEDVEFEQLSTHVRLADRAYQSGVALPRNQVPP